MICYYCAILSFCFNLPKLFSILYCVNKQTSEVSGCLADIYLYILCSCSLDVLPWPLVQFGSPGAKITWIPLHPHPHDLLFDRSYLYSSLCQSSSETQTAYVHSKDSKLKTDNHPHTPQPQSHTQIQVKKTSCVLTKGCGADSTRDIWYPQSPSCCWWSKELPLIV